MLNDSAIRRLVLFKIVYTETMYFFGVMNHMLYIDDVLISPLNGIQYDSSKCKLVVKEWEVCVAEFNADQQQRQPSAN